MTPNLNPLPGCSLKAFRKLDWRGRRFCLDCAVLLLEGEEKAHSGELHRLETGLTKHQLRAPSTLLPTITHKDKESVREGPSPRRQ